MVPIRSGDVLQELCKLFLSILSPLTLHNTFSLNISAFGLPEKNVNVGVCSFKYLTNRTDPLLVLDGFPLASTFWNCLKV